MTLTPSSECGESIRIQISTGDTSSQGTSGDGRQSGHSLSVRNPSCAMAPRNRTLAPFALRARQLAAVGHSIPERAKTLFVLMKERQTSSAPSGGPVALGRKGGASPRAGGDSTLSLLFIRLVLQIHQKPVITRTTIIIHPLRHHAVV